MNNTKTAATIKRAAWTFVQAAVATLIIVIPGVMQAPNLSVAKGLAVTALIAALSAGISAVKNLLLTPAEVPGGHPAS